MVTGGDGGRTRCDNGSVSGGGRIGVRWKVVVYQAGIVFVTKDISLMNKKMQKVGISE